MGSKSTRAGAEEEVKEEEEDTAGCTDGCIKKEKGKHVLGVRSGKSLHWTQ